MLICYKVKNLIKLLSVSFQGEGAYGQQATYNYDLSLVDTAVAKNQFLPKIWAKLKIEHLLVEYYRLDENSQTAKVLLNQIVENTGKEGSVVVSKVLESSGDFGYNAKTGEYVQMLAEGIIDPTKVTRVALENAASVSGMILTTECALIDIKEDAPAMPPMGGGGMPGMM